MGATVYRVRIILALLTLAIGVLAVSAPGTMAADDAGKLKFSIQPYLWTPTIEADLKFSAPDGSTGEPEIKVEPDDRLSSHAVG